jgi:regulator of nonsense transcripts 3
LNKNSKAKESVFSRAYFHLKTMEAVVAFHQGFDGHVFVDSRGNDDRIIL